MDFKALYDFHGHRCPMSTMGARLGMAAMSALGVSKADQFHIEAKYHARNCALDGIQFVTGCTLGNSNITFEDSGMPALVLGKRDGSSSVTATVSEKALHRLSEHKKKKAALIEEREISGLARAMDIDREIKSDFDRLVEWVQDAPEADLVKISGGLNEPEI